MPLVSLVYILQFSLRKLLKVCPFDKKTSVQLSQTSVHRRSCERVWKTVPEKGVFSFVPFCLRSLRRFARYEWCRVSSIPNETSEPFQRHKIVTNYVTSTNFVVTMMTQNRWSHDDLEQPHT